MHADKRHLKDPIKKKGQTNVPIKPLTQPRKQFHQCSLGFMQVRRKRKKQAAYEPDYTISHEGDYILAMNRILRRSNEQGKKGRDIMGRDKLGVVTLLVGWTEGRNSLSSTLPRKCREREAKSDKGESCFGIILPQNNRKNMP